MEKKTIINIGRQFGSGGKTIANVIGEKLGIPVYDNELISKAAEQSGFSKDLFIKSDEKRSLFSLSNFFASDRFGLADSYVGDNDLFKIQSQVIMDIAEAGSAIFIGRCSDYILRHMDCLNVFISAPIESRIKRVSERMSVSPKEAKEMIERSDRTRETYYNFFTMGNWGVASNYDVCFDSSLLGTDETAGMIIEIAKKKGLY